MKVIPGLIEDGIKVDYPIYVDPTFFYGKIPVYIVIKPPWWLNLLLKRTARRSYDRV